MEEEDGEVKEEGGVEEEEEEGEVEEEEEEGEEEEVNGERCYGTAMNMNTSWVIKVGIKGVA